MELDGGAALLLLGVQKTLHVSFRQLLAHWRGTCRPMIQARDETSSRKTTLHPARPIEDSKPEARGLEEDSIYPEPLSSAFNGTCQEDRQGEAS